MVSMLACACAAWAGSERLASRFASARADAEVAWRTAHAGDQRALFVEAMVEARRATRTGAQWILRIERGLDPARLVPRRVVLYADAEALETDAGPARADRLLIEGERVRVAIRLSPLLGRRNPGSEDIERRWRWQGIGARARLVDPRLVVAVGPSGSGARLARLRRAIREALSRGLPEARAGAGLARALVLGDRHGLSERTTAAMRDLGVSHLIAISGLHVGLVAGGAASCLRVIAAGFRRIRGCGRGVRSVGRVWAGPSIPGLAALAAAGYGWLAGAPPSALRAVAVLALLLSARMLGRPLAPARALWLAAIGLWAVEPGLAIDPGARLSFAACAGLIFVSGHRRGTDPPPTGLRARAREALRYSVAAAAATAPLLRPAEGGGVAWGPLCNLVAIPGFAALVLPASIVAAGAGAAGAQALAGRALGVVAASEAGVTATAEHLAVSAAGRLVERSSGPATLEPYGGAAGWVVCAMAIGVLWALRRDRVGIGLVAWSATTWLAAAAGSVGALAGVPPPPRVVFFDVGQGDAAVLQSTADAILIDAGGGRPGPGAGRAVERALRSLGIHRLTALVLTHGDFDHRGGASRLLEGDFVERLWLPASERKDSPLVDLAEKAAARGIAVEWLGAGDRRSIGDALEVRVLWPDRAEGGGAVAAGGPRSRRNDGSLVLGIRHGPLRTLWTGDISARVEAILRERGVLSPVDLLKVAHHGSRFSTSPAFLDAVSPRLALVSGPCLSARGLPHGAALDRLESAGATVAWTGRDGAVYVWPGAPGGPPGWRGHGVSRPCPSRISPTSPTSPDRVIEVR